LKGGWKLLCANLADPAPTGATSDRSPAATGAASMSAGHGPPPAARNGSAAPAVTLGLSAGHGPLHATRGRGPTVAIAPGLLVGHGPLHAARGHDPAAAIGLWWTCAPNNSFLTSVSDSTHELVALERSKFIGVLSPIHHDGLECKRLVLEILYECFGQ